MRTWGSLVSEIPDHIYHFRGISKWEKTPWIVVNFLSQSWFLVSVALAKPKKLRVMKWREHSPSTSACGWGSSPGVDALCRLSLLFPAVLALAPLRIYSGHSGLPIAPLGNQHFVIPIRSDTDEHLKTIFGCGSHLCFEAPEADTANGKSLSVCYMPGIKYRVFCDDRYCIAWRKDGRFFLSMVFFLSRQQF